MSLSFRHLRSITVLWLGLAACVPALASAAATVSDGGGGLYNTWVETRNGNADIYVQHLNSTGVALWPTSGLPACKAAGDQTNPELTTDGAGGVIVVWEDLRSGTSVIYTQRLNSSGSPIWTLDGFPVTTAASAGTGPTVASDGTGGAFVAWEDLRNPTIAIYGQRIDSVGTRKWGAPGILVASQSAEQYEPAIIADQKGGALVVWSLLTASFTYDLYAQRLTAVGARVWASAGKPVVVATGDQSSPDLAADGSGGLYVVWEDDRDDLFTQARANHLVAADGSANWAADVALITDTNGQSRPHVIANGTTAMIAAWDDWRYAVFAQKLAGATGARAWTVNGVALSDLGEGQTLAHDATDGALIAWNDPRDGSSSVYSQRVNAAGVPQWTAGGVPVSRAIDEQLYPEIAADGVGGMVMAWEDHRATDADTYAQRITAAGAPQWAINGVPVRIVPGIERNPAVAADGAGGGFLVWQEKRNGAYDIYAQHWNASGAFLWSPAVRVCAAAGTQQVPHVIADGAGGVIVAWYDGRSATTGYFGDLYAQRLNAAGVRQWAADGIPVCTATDDQDELDMIADGAGGAILTWEDWRGGVNSDIYAQRVSAAGAPVWAANGVAVNASVGDQYRPRLVLASPGSAIMAWTDFRSADPGNIYAQRVTAAGTLGWTAAGVPVCSAANQQSAVAVATDGARGAILGWQDERAASGITDLYAQRIDSTGAVKWAANGVVVNTSAGNQLAPVIVASGAGGAIVTWSDNRGSSSDIYGQRLKSNGTLAWAATGVAVCTAANAQTHPSLVADGAAGAVFGWSDERLTPGAPVVYAQRLDSTGVVKWAANGLPLATAGSPQLALSIAPDGAGGVVAAWQDGRNPAEFRIYGQRLNGAGTRMWTGAGDPSVDVPNRSASGAELAARMAPNPVSDHLRVSFVLPTWEPASIELVDIAGRRAQFRKLDGFGPGSHSLELDSVRPLPAGVYFVRLRQGARVAGTRVTVVH